MDFPERDWKYLRSIERSVLERYCVRVLKESLAIIDDADTAPHDRYLRLFRLLDERDRTMARAFNDMRRSTAFRRLASWVELELVREDELSRFSPAIQESATGLAEILASRTRP